MIVSGPDLRWSVPMGPDPKASVRAIDDAMRLVLPAETWPFGQQMLSLFDAACAI